MSALKKVGGAAAVGVSIAIAWACSDQSILTCTDIPDGGCPSQEGVACQDPTCAATYNCQNGVWVLAQVCPASDASVQDTSIDAPEASAFDAAGYDAPPGAFGGPGCVDLEPPDCPLGTALLCTNGCCGCEDLYVCDDGGWDPYGECTDDAGITTL